MKKKHAKDKVREMLSLIPLLYANQGISLDNVLPLSPYETKRDLTAALEHIMMFGKPPFTPSDFIEIFIDEEQKVFLNFPQGMERPLALKEEEARVLREVLTKYAEESSGKSGDIYPSLLKKISNIPVDTDSTTPFDARNRIIQEAIDEEFQIEFQYRSISSRDTIIRRVDPWALLYHGGAAYLIGYCHLREAPRYFHLERMEDIEILDLERISTIPDNLNDLIENSPIFKKNPGGIQVEAAFRYDTIRTAGSYFTIENSEPYRNPGSEDQWFKSQFRVPDIIWFRLIMRSFGNGAVIIGPEHLVESAIQELKEIPIPGNLE